MPGFPLSAKETAVGETPASLASSRVVSLAMALGAVLCIGFEKSTGSGVIGILVALGAGLLMEEIARIRKREAANSAAIIGAEYICLDYNDEMFFEDKAARMAFINLIRHCRADVILTHNPHDYNPDHELTSKIVNDVAVMIPIAHLKTEEPPYPVIPSIWYFETANSMGFVPTDYVDITDYYETKMKMLGCMLPQTDDILDRAVNISVGVVDKGLGSGCGINIKSDTEEINAVAKHIREVVLSL